MKKIFKDRSGNIIEKESSQETLLKMLYTTLPGRLALKLLTAPLFSELAGNFCDSRASQKMIIPFIRRAKIDMSEYEPAAYRSFNDFFTRKIRPEVRPTDMTPEHFISPCDAKLYIYEINEHSVFKIKNSFYSISSLVKNNRLASEYSGGLCMIFRLEPDNYHRYIYIDNGNSSHTCRIKGRFHTVNPISLGTADVYSENTREVTILHTENFGDVVQAEIGAMMVGRISNFHKSGTFRRGTEKGLFEFGGSTIVLLVKKGTILPDRDIIRNTAEGFETIVKTGEKIGRKI